METEIVVALAGNPNSGKTSIFNALTGSRQHVGNWPGVTVELKEGTVQADGRTIRVVDLPGIYSLSPYSQEEVIARDFILQGGVNVVVNVVDASNMERNLYLTTQLLELGLPTVVALNMIDAAEKSGQEMDAGRLSQMLGATVVRTVGNRVRGADEVVAAVIENASAPDQHLPRSPRHNAEVEAEIAKLAHTLRLTPKCRLPERWLLVKALEGDQWAVDRLEECAFVTDGSRAQKPAPADGRTDSCASKSSSIEAAANKPAPQGRAAVAIVSARKHMEEVFGEDLETVIADGRYGFIGGLLREVVTTKAIPDRIRLTERIDAILLNRVLGIPIFLFLMWLTFRLTFDVGGFFVRYVTLGVSLVGMGVERVLPAGPLTSLITDGVITGVGAVVVFLPNIAIMFVMISFLEDSGYMARAAFLMDRTMHLLGLHGKSFIPLLMGFGCNVPAIMATRTLDTPEDRIVTALINPFISCAARLPIYVLMAGAFFPNNGAWVILSIYVLGIVMAVVSGKLFRRVFFPKSASPFVMELPPYRMPTLRGTALHVWERVYLFISRAGTVILAAAVLIWVLSYLPAGVKFGSDDSLVGILGRAVEPAVRPLGLNWHAAMALLLGVGSKEIVVSTLGVLGGNGGAHHAGRSLGAAVTSSFTPLAAYVFMVFSLAYIPCIATIATIKRETNSWKWAIFSVVYSLALAYLVALTVYRTGLMMGFK